MTEKRWRATALWPDLNGGKPVAAEGTALEVGRQVDRWISHDAGTLELTVEKVTVRSSTVTALGEAARQEARRGHGD